MLIEKVYSPSILVYSLLLRMLMRPWLPRGQGLLHMYSPIDILPACMNSRNTEQPEAALAL